MACLQEHSNVGQTMEKLTVSEQNLVIEDFGLTSKTKRKRKPTQVDKSSQSHPKKKSKSRTAESVLANKKTTSSDNPHIYLTNIPDIELSQTSDQASTSRGKDFYQFWNSSHAEEYKKLWLPAKTDCVDLPLTSLHGCVTKMMSNSWFSTKVTSHQTRNSQKTSWPSCKYSVVDGTAKDDTPKKLRVRKVRIYPHPHQKEIFRKIVGCTRKIYNKSIDIIKSKTLPFDNPDEWLKKEDERKARFKDPDKYKATENPWWNRLYVRNFVALNTATFTKEHPYLKETPKATREAAVNEAFVAFNGNMTKLKAGTIPKFGLEFRTKKQEAVKGWAFTVSPTTVKDSRLFPHSFKTFGHLTVAPSQRKFLKEKYKHEIKIQKDKYGDYYMIIVEEPDESRFENQEAKTSSSPRIISIDPGVRTRHTLYSNTGFAMEIGSGDITRLCRIAKHFDRCFGQRCNKKLNNHRKRRMYLRKEKNLRKRAKNLICEMNDKTIKFLTDNSDVVIIPPFQVKDMVNKKTSCLRKETRKQMLSWSHYGFRERLISKARMMGTTVLVASEHYTSKTCGKCGGINGKLGSNKVFKCPSCNFIADRDVNGARNILLRSIRITKPKGEV